MANLITRLTLDSGQFDRNITGASKKVRDLDKQFANTRKGLSNFGSGLGLNIGSLGGFTTALGAAAVAGAALNKFLKSSQALSDAFNNNIAAAKTTVDSFFFALSSGNFDSFTDGFANAWKRAREIAEGDDEIGDIKLSDSLFDAEFSNSLTKLELIAKDKSKNMSERLGAVRDAENLIKEQMTRNLGAMAKNDEQLLRLVETYAVKDATVQDVKDFLKYGNNSTTASYQLLQTYKENLAKIDKIQNDIVNNSTRVVVTPTGASYTMKGDEEKVKKLRQQLDTWKLLTAELEKQDPRLKKWVVLEQHVDELRKKEAEYLLDNEKREAFALAKQKELLGIKNKLLGVEEKTAQVKEEKTGARVKSTTVNDRLTGISIGMAANQGTPANLVPTQLQGVSMVDTTTDALAEFNRQLQAMSAAQSIIGSIGDAMRSLTGDTMAARAATAALVVVTEALAVAEAVKSASGGDPYTIAVRIAAAAAACISAFASVGFAEGGIVGGSGGRKSDKVNVRASAGEMILTGQQQANLWHMVNNTGVNGTGGQVEFKIKGTELYGVLSNYNNKRGRII